MDHTSENIKLLEQGYKFTEPWWFKGFNYKYVVKEDGKYNSYKVENSKVTLNYSLDNLHDYEFFEHMVILPATTTYEGREQFVHLCCNKVIDFMYQEGFDLNDINCYRNDIKHFTMIFMPSYTPSYKDDEGVIYYPKVTLESNWVDNRLELHSYVECITDEGEEHHLNSEIELHKIDHLNEAKEQCLNIEKKLLEKFPDFIEQNKFWWKTD